MRAVFDGFRAQRFFGSLDGLRCLSILAVIWHHTGSKQTPFGLSLLSRGFMGVDLFFVISGFLITTLLLREKQERGRISLRRFYLRRTLRIFPLYYTVLAVYVVLVLVLERGTSRGHNFFHNLPYFLSYTSNWFVELHAEHVIFYFVWSLAAEEQFYVFWPSVEKLLPPRVAALVMAGLLCVVAWFQAGYGDALLAPGSLPYRIVTRSPVAIGLGVLLAHALHHPRTFGWLARVLGYEWSAPLALAALIVVLALPSVSAGSIHWVMTALVASVVMREDNGLAPLLRAKPVAHVGVVSYGMYLMHMLACNFARQVVARAHLSQPLVLFVLTVLGAVLAASLSYRYYEGFFLRLKERLSRRPDVASGGA